MLALSFLAAFVVKLPLFPFHAWLVRAYVAAPLPVALVLSGIVAKTAAYGIIRLCFGIFPLGMETLAPGLIALAAVGTLYAALLATRQSDTRALIAYSSLSHLNLIGLGIFAGSAAGLQAGLVASVSHGLVVAALFLLAGMLAARTGGFDLGRAGGLAGSAPILAACFTLAVIAAIGVPGTSGFAGEFLVLLAAYARYPIAGALATLVVIIAAVYGLGLLRRAFAGPPDRTVADLSWRERGLVLPLLALILVLGVAPRLVSDLVPGDALRAPRAAAAADGRRAVDLVRGHAVERHDIKRAMRGHREVRLRRVAAVEQIAAPVGDKRRPFEEAPVGGVLFGLEGIRRLQHPKREIVSAHPRGACEALAGAKMRFAQHLRDLRPAVPGVPGRFFFLCVFWRGEIAANDIDEGHAVDRARRVAHHHHPVDPHGAIG